MQWWNELETWITSDAGWRVISTAVIPFVAILVAGLLGALIARSSAKRVVAHHDRESKAAAVIALIGVGRRATVWSSLGGEEKQRVDNQLSEADIRIRLLPVNGANSAADWAAHELAGMKKNSASYSFQADQSFTEYRDRLLEWQNKPKRARKLFAFDLEQWRYDDDALDKTLVEKQRKWSAGQAEERDAAAAVAKSPVPSAGDAVVDSPRDKVAANTGGDSVGTGDDVADTRDGVVDTRDDVADTRNDVADTRNDSVADTAAIAVPSTADAPDAPEHTRDGEESPAVVAQPVWTASEHSGLRPADISRPTMPRPYEYPTATPAAVNSSVATDESDARTESNSDSDSDSDSDSGSDSGHGYGSGSGSGDERQFDESFAPPVTAGTVRRRTDPESPLDQRGTY